MPKGKRRSAGGDRTDGSARPRSLSRGHGGPARAPRPAPRAPLPAGPALTSAFSSPPVAPSSASSTAATRVPPARQGAPSRLAPPPAIPTYAALMARARAAAAGAARGAWAALPLGARPPLCGAQAGGARPMCSERRSARLGSALPGGETRGGGGAGRGGRRGGAGEGRARQSTAKRDETSRVPGRCPRSERRPLRGGVGRGRPGGRAARTHGAGGGREAAPRSKQQQTAARTGCLRAADALPSLLLPPAPPGRSVNVKAAVAGPLWGAALCRVRSVAVGAAGRAAVGALRSQRGPSAGTASRGADGASETERLGYTTETAASDRRYCSEGLPQRLISDRGTKGGGQRGSAPL